MQIKNKSKIAILMATYNGEKYLREQINSIINQTYKDWTLYIRDDGSNDNTLSIIKYYTEIYENIILLTDNEKGLGPQYNFIRLLERVKSELYMFSDQDDVWLPNKIELSINAYNENLESDIPVIVHTNISLVDANLNILVKDRWQSVGIKPEKLKTYNCIAICNFCQGSTMLFNHKLKEASLPVKEYSFMHDWWLATRCLKNCGKIITIKDPLMLYRQHESNVMGMKAVGRNTFKQRCYAVKNAMNENIKLYNEIAKDGYGSFLKFLWYKSYIMCTRIS